MWYNASGVSWFSLIREAGSMRGHALSVSLVAAAAFFCMAASQPPAGGLNGVGSYCDHSTNCSAPHSICVNHTCTCSSGYETNESTCIIKLNNKCNTTHICNRTGAQCIDNLCVCSLNYVLSGDHQNCLPVVKNLNEFCDVHAQCREIINSTCTHGECQCIPEHYYNVSQRSCQRIEKRYSSAGQQPNGNSPHRNELITYQLGLGGNCTTTANCSTQNAECINKTCICSTGYYQNGSNCTKQSNGTCSKPTDCIGNGTTCNLPTKKCVCDSYHIESYNGRTCLKLATKPLDMCTENQQCKNVRYTSCFHGRCYCTDGYFLNKTNLQCVYAPCEKGECKNMGFASCIQGICSCSPGTIKYGNFCYKQIGKVGEKCDSQKWEMCFLTDDGYNQNVECTSGKCTCKKNFKSTKDKKRCVSGALKTVSSIFVVMVTVVTVLHV